MFTFNQSVNYLDKFEVYLEGIKVPFIGFSISEADNSLPAAQITFSSQFEVVRVLPGTIVQIFGKVLNPFTDQEEFILLFEGKVVSLSYQMSSSSTFVSLSAISLLSNFIKAKIRPADVIISARAAQAENPNSDDVLTDNLLYAIHSYNDETFNGIMTNNTLATYENTKKEDKSFVGTKKQLGEITLLGNLGDEFLKYFQEGGKCRNGNFLPLILDFLVYFEESDKYFGIESRSFKIKESMFAFPNSTSRQAFKYNCLNDALAGYYTRSIDDNFGSDSRLNLSYIYSVFNDYMFYKTVYPASFTYVNRFYDKDSKVKKAPLRGFFLPDLDSGPPPLCNIIFAENISNFNYECNFEAEPTRVISQAVFGKNSDQTNISKLIYPIYVAPNIILKEDNNGKVRSNFTLEESYRGINYKYSRFDSTVASLYYQNQNSSNVSSEDSDQINISGLQSNLNEFMKEYALSEYIKLKYSTRRATVVTEWNPYRLVGLPALILLPDKPCILGIIDSISTQIDSRGRALSQYTLKNCRVLVQESLNSVFKDILDKESKFLDGMLINDFTENYISVLNNYLYDPELYSFQNLGKFVYTYLINGTTSNLKDIVAKQKEKYFDIDDSIKNDEEKEIFYDYSILNFALVKSEDGTYKFIIPGSSKLKKLTESFLNYRYIVYLYLSLYFLRDNYKKLRHLPAENVTDKTPLYKFIMKLNWRNIITKEEYLNYINALNDMNLIFADSKDLFAILNKLFDSNKPFKFHTNETLPDYLVYNNQGREAYLKDIVKLAEDPKTVLDIQENYFIKILDLYKEFQFDKIDQYDNLFKETSIFKPYNIIRKAHVYYAFYNYMKAKNIWEINQE